MLPLGTQHPLTAIEEEALHKWVRARSQNATSLSYEKLQSISNQLSEYPDRLQWKQSIGEGREIERVGGILLYHDKFTFDNRNSDSNYAKSIWTMLMPIFILNLQ